MILLIKRLVTAAVLFVVLFLVFLIGALMVGGAIAGGRAGANNQNPKDFQAGYEAGRQAGMDFARRYGPTIRIGAFGLSLASSLALSFSGALPWCRRQPEPPPLAQP